MSEKKSNDGCSCTVGPFGVLFIVFVVLKLTGVMPVAGWSWWWITAPLWIPWGLIILVLAGSAIIAVLTVAVAGIFSWIQDRRWTRRSIR